MNTHSIKLKGPWTVRLLPSSGATGEPQVVHLPADWKAVFGDVAGTAVFQRRFNRPTGLTAGHRVRIQLHGVTELIAVRLNDRPRPVELGTDGTASVDLTDGLQPHNVLSVEIRFDPCAQPGRPGGLWQPVVIEIEEPVDSPP
ncbi:MAG: hypothetical protein U0992_22210 [Planctomycetaceae bacterium]